MAGGEFGYPGRNALLGDVPAPVVRLAGLMAIIYIGMWLAPSSIDYALSERLGFEPARLHALGAGMGPGASAAIIATLFTHAFLHASFAHLGFNLLWLTIFGAPVARRLRSGIRFYLFFLCCAAAGGLFFYLFHLNDSTLLVGASGGITGLLGGLIRFAFHRPFSRRESVKGILPLTDRSVLVWAIAIILMNASVVLFGPLVGGGNDNIAWEAHVGGFLFGLIAFPLFDPDDS